MLVVQKPSADSQIGAAAKFLVQKFCASLDHLPTGIEREDDFGSDHVVRRVSSRMGLHVLPEVNTRAPAQTLFPAVTSVKLIGT